MADTRTAVSEIVTGLGLFGFRDLGRAIAARPRFITNVDDTVFDELEEAHAAGRHAEVFETAWANGQRFARAEDGLRGRPPWTVEWKGPHKPPAYEQIPADLRVDHVYLISCKYGSKILQNASPANLFDRALVERRTSADDWFWSVAPTSYQELYDAAVAHVGITGLPDGVHDLDRADRQRLRRALPGRWPAELREQWELVAFEIARASAARLATNLRTKGAREAFVWRLLRLQAAPYFVLGADLRDTPIHYRVTTPWDFRSRFSLRSVDLWGEHAGQPMVRWRIDVRDQLADVDRVVEGHVEIRWSHGKFASVPEAKIYLDTPHHEVAGYEPLDDGN